MVRFEIVSLRKYAFDRQYALLNPLFKDFNGHLKSSKV